MPYFIMISIKTIFHLFMRPSTNPQQATQPSDKNYMSETYIGAIFIFNQEIEVLSFKCEKWHWKLRGKKLWKAEI